MPIIASQHAWKDKEHIPLSSWPDDCMVQWGGQGVVLSQKPGGNYRTAFFEAFPKKGGFIRGEGKTIEEAEADAFGQYRKISACDHAWSRKSYTNGGGICRTCGGFMTVFKPIVKLGEFAKPLSPSALDMVADGHMRPSANGESARYARRQWLKAKRMGIDLPDFDTAPPLPAGFLEDDYAEACRKAVVAFLRKNPDLLQASADGRGVSGIFEGVHICSLQMMLEEDEAEAENAPAL